MKIIILIAIVFIVGCDGKDSIDPRVQQNYCAKSKQEKILQETQKCWTNLKGSHSEELDEAIDSCHKHIKSIFCPWRTQE